MQKRRIKFQQVLIQQNNKTCIQKNQNRNIYKNGNIIKGKILQEYQCIEMHKILIIKKMYNNDKNLQLYVPKQISQAIIQWLDKQVHQIYTTNKKRINLSIVINDIFSQPFLPKFLLKINYDFFSKTQMMDFIDSTALRKLSNDQRKLRFIGFIQKYLHSFERRKFTQNYKNFLLNFKQDSNKQITNHQIIRILLFIAIRSQNKNEFIERIFNMTTQSQQTLMDQIMEVERILQKISQKQELAIQLNSLKGLNKKLKDNYQQLIDNQNKLLDQCQRQESSKTVLQQKNQQNRQQKINVYQNLGINDVQKPYLKIYKNIQDKNTTLVRILTQKQRKQNQLLQHHRGLKQKSDQFQQVLFELNRQRKKLKVVLNEKKNESFNLQMRASLRMSMQKQKLRKSQALKKRAQLSNKNPLCDISNNTILRNQKSKLRQKDEKYSQINQSVNVLSKIQQLKSQKQSLIKQLDQLKAQNQKLKLKDNLSQNTFVELKQVYSKILQLCPEFIENNKKLHKQRSKTSFKPVSNRYNAVNAS